MKCCIDCGSLIRENPFCPECGTARMFNATTANMFCGHCNKVFAGETAKCPVCKRPTKPVQETHLKGNVILLSGMEAVTLWADRSRRRRALA